MITRRQFLISCIGSIAAISGLSFAFEYDKLTKSVPILLYHRVGSEHDDYTVPVTRFQKDMETLNNGGYTALSLKQVKQHIQNKDLPLPEKSIALTFDDGYLDNYINAFPILQKYSMTASFYIISGMVGENNRLTASQIREMDSAGMDFGSHTVTHRLLATLTPDETRTELEKSKFDLEQMLGKTVDFLAYPGGSYNDSTLKIANETGYIGGFSTHSGFESFDKPFEIKRIPIFHYDRSIVYIIFRKGVLPGLRS